MRITTGSKLTARDVQEAANLARTQHGQDIFVEEIATSPRGAITFYCEGYHGRFATNRRGGVTGRAAKWSAWGYMIAELFRRDPSARIGQYRGVDDFRRQCTDYFPHRERYGDSLDFLELVEGIHAAAPA